MISSLDSLSEELYVLRELRNSFLEQIKVPSAFQERCAGRSGKEQNLL